MENNFYLDVFNKILNVNDKQIFIVFDKDNNIWFKYADILNIIGYKDLSKAMININIDNKYICKYSKLKGLESDSRPFNFQPHTIMINNNGPWWDKNYV